jgi:hypothetical protein
MLPAHARAARLLCGQLVATALVPAACTANVILALHVGAQVPGPDRGLERRASRGDRVELDHLAGHDRLRERTVARRDPHVPVPGRAAGTRLASRGVMITVPCGRVTGAVTTYRVSATSAVPRG